MSVVRHNEGDDTSATHLHVHHDFGSARKSAGRAIARRAGSVVAGHLLWLKIGASVIAVATALGVIAAAAEHHRPPPGTTVSTLTVLRSLRKITDFHAATAKFQVTVTVSQRAGWWPSWLVGRSLRYIGIGTDDAVVNLAPLTGDAVSRSGGSVSVTVPPPVVGPAELDVAASNAATEKQGVFSRLHDLFSSDSGIVKQAQVAAVRAIHLAAERSKLVSEGEASTRALLTGLLRRLGFRHVTVTFR